MSSLQLLLIILPLGLDTLGVSLSLGIKSLPRAVSGERQPPSRSSYGWLRLALLFSLAEMLMPVVGLGIGYAVSLAVSNVMHYVGPLLLIGVGVWEVWEEGREYLRKRRREKKPLQLPSDPKSAATGNKNGAEPLSSQRRMRRGQPLLLALSVSLDELAIGFSLGSITSGKAVSPLLLCLLIGLQGFVLTVTGLFLGRTLRARLKPLQEGSEYLSALLLIGLGAWLIVS
jgi:manganese efflux pump family protein